MMPGAAYATPHSIERDGYLHSVAPVTPPKRAFDFFALWLSRNTRAGIWPLRSAGKTM
jgi:hypothetical protein